MDDGVIEEDGGLAGGQPTTDQSGPVGGGTHSASAAGGNKADPVSTGPNLGNTIAGRSADLRTSERVDNSGGYVRDLTSQDRRPTPGDDTTGQETVASGGVSGTTGREQGDDHEHSLATAAEDVNPGEAQTGAPGAPK